MSDPAYSASEMMIAVAARMLTGARTVFRRRRSPQYRLQLGARHRRSGYGVDL